MCIREKKEYTEAEKNDIQRWRYYGVYLCFFPLLLVHVMKWIMTGEVHLQALAVDFLLLGFSLAVTVFGVVADEFAGGKHRTKLRTTGFISFIGGIVFLVTHIVYQTLSLDKKIQVIFLIAFLALEVVFIVYEYFAGKRIRVWQVGDAPDEQ